MNIVMKITPETTQADVDREQAYAKERAPIVAALTETYRKAGRPKAFIDEFSRRLDDALHEAQLDGKAIALKIYDRDAPSKNTVKIELKQNSKERTR